MEFDLESYMAARGLTEPDRQRLRDGAKHSFSIYSETGTHLEQPFETENLLSVLMQMERYIVDSNLPDSMADARQPQNRNKAFILGQTFTDEQENLEAAILRPCSDNPNNNIFEFGFVGDEVRWLPTPCLMLSRLDVHLTSAMDSRGLRLESRPRIKRMKDDLQFVERERKHMADVYQFKTVICNDILHCTDIENLPPPEYTERKKTQLIEIIRSKAPRCFRNYQTACEVASLCYAAVLLESDRLGLKTREEFCDPNRRNVFGDTRLIQNALWLNARILSNDGAVKRMVEYLNLPELATKQKV